MEESRIDLAVIGCGVAGQSIAYTARKAGKSVSIFESGPPGGTCPTRGCDAKKPLVNAAKRLVQARAMIGSGLAGQLHLDWSALMDFKRQFTQPIPGRTREDLREAGIELIEACPRFLNAHTLEADGRRWRAEQIVIASGLRPRTLELPGGGAEHTIDSDGFLELDQLPGRVVFVGGGYIAMEFAGVAAAAGARVTVLEMGTYPLGQFDQDVVRELLAAYEDLGVHVLTQRKVEAIRPLERGFEVDCGGAAPTIEADLVVNATGRVPSIDGLDLDAAGIDHGKAGVKVDSHLRSVSQPHVWAAGDVADTGRPPLTPTASEDGRVVAHNLLNPDALREQIQTPVASVAFTLPPVASAGMSEQAAREAYGDGIEVAAGSMAGWKHFRQQNEKHAYYKLIFDPDTKLIGAHLVGADCDEVINMFATALDSGCDKASLCDTTLAYPTVGFNLQNVFAKQKK